MHEDFNMYDSAHVAVKPERMSSDELLEAYRNTWEQFYSTRHMVNILKIWRHDSHCYKEKLAFFMWYLYASRIERLHPMNCGFWTVRRRNDRRSGLAHEAMIPFWWNRLKVITARLVGMAKLFFQLEDVWLRSRAKSKIEEGLFELIVKTKQGVMDWRDVKEKELVGYYRKLQAEIPEIRVPSVVQLWLRKRNPFAQAFSRTYVRRIWHHWYFHLWNPLKWIEVWLFEGVNGIRFLQHLLGNDSDHESTSFSSPLRMEE